MSVSGRYSLAFDTLIRHVFSTNFLSKNPRFKELEEKLKTCQEQYKIDVQAAGCACRMTPEWAKPCIISVLEILERARTDDHDTARKFIRFVTRKKDDDDVDGLGVSIFVADKKYDITIIKQGES